MTQLASNAEIHSAHSDYLDPEHVHAAFGEATARYWRRRAKTFEDALPKPDDYTGQATPATLASIRDSLQAQADACHNRAAIAETQGPSPEDRDLINRLLASPPTTNATPPPPATHSTP